MQAHGPPDTTPARPQSDQARTGQSALPPLSYNLLPHTQGGRAGVDRSTGSSKHRASKCPQGKAARSPISIHIWRSAIFPFFQMSPPGLTPQPGSPTPTSESGNQSPPTNVDREEVESKCDKSLSACKPTAHRTRPHRLRSTGRLAAPKRAKASGARPRA